ncbi:MAG: GerAB/ArcD/ProY family transporter [Eubacterium sp.]|nr:GerAB/ArcD/ProY family transporter [Eubacterium sp.]
MKYKRGMISPFTLFAMLFVSRVLVIFGVCSTNFAGVYAPDMLISLGIGLAIALALCVPIVFAANKKKELIKPKWLSVIYGVYFLYLGAITVGRFSFFASMEMNVKSQALFHALLIILAGAYAAWLGIEPISRFGSFIFAVTIIGIVCIVAFGIKDFSILNLFPFSKNNTVEIMENALDFAGETGEIILLAVLAPKVNGKINKAFFSAIILSFAVCGILFIYSSGVLGDVADIAAFPFYDLSQLSRLGNARLDSVYTAFWIFAVFLKCALFLYCASECFGFKKKGTSCAVSAIGLFTIVFVLSKLEFYLHSQILAIVIPFIVFGFIIPSISLLFTKKSKGEILIEKL